MPQGRNRSFRGTTLITAIAVTLQGSNKPPAMVTGHAVATYLHGAFGGSAREPESHSDRTALTAFGGSLKRSDE